MWSRRSTSPKWSCTARPEPTEYPGVSQDWRIEAFYITGAGGRRDDTLDGTLGSVLLAAACDSGLSGFPTPVPQRRHAHPGHPGHSARRRANPYHGHEHPGGHLIEGTVHLAIRHAFKLGRDRPVSSIRPDGADRREVGCDARMDRTFSWPVPPYVFLVAPSGAWVVSQGGWPEKHVSLPATNGLTYRIVVMSYGPSAQAFVLRVDLQP